MSALHDIKIVSLAVNLPGPLFVSRLAAFGAKVTKVEPPQGDPLGIHFPKYYKELLGKQQVRTLDLKETKARDELFRLLMDADIFVTASRRNSLEKLGLGWEELHEKFPRLIHISFTSFSGKRADEPAHDLNFQAEQGFVQPPNLPQTCWADIAGAQEAVIRAFAALSQRKQSGEGSLEEVALGDALQIFSGPIRHKLAGGKSTLLGGAVPEYNLYEASDGWVAVAALEPHLKNRLEEESGVAPLKADALKKFFKTKPALHWEEWGRKKEIPVSKVR